MNCSARGNSLSAAARSGQDIGEQFRAIAELGGAVAWIVDCASGLPTYISPSIEQLLGYERAELHDQLGGKNSDGPLSELCAGLSARLQRFSAGDQSRRCLVRQFEQRCKDGRVIPIEVVSTLLVNENGAPGALVGVLRDISERREQERAQRRFASMLNHEFRTPLSTIDGAIQRLEVTGARADQATRQRYRKIQNAVDRLTGMLDEYLSPERMDAIGRQRASASAAPRLLLEQGAEQVRAAGRPVLVQAGDLPESLRCEPEGLRLALKVLVENAIDYGAPDRAIELHGRRADGGIELVVRDHGAGVAAGDIDLIFGKGYRGRNSAGRPGSGLGLYMARSVVEVHGGSLTVCNMEQGGASFRLWLPAHNGLGRPLAPHEGAADHSGSQEERGGDEQKSHQLNEHKTNKVASP